METIVVKVKAVRVFVNEDSASVKLTFDKSFKGYKVDDGERVKADVDSISFGRSDLTRQLCAASDDIAMYRAICDHAFDQKQFGVILFNAKLKINREFKSAGEVIGEGDDAQTIEKDCYLTQIASVELNDRAIRAIDNATSL